MKIAILALALVLGFASIGPARADGRTNSERLGGYTSTGKGSHYYGGYNAHKRSAIPKAHKGRSSKRMTQS
jgi:hypothetical protein